MAKKVFELKGVKKFMDNLNKEIRELEGRTLQGLIEAVIELQREAEPGTPLDLGNLRSSWFSVSFKSGAGDLLIGEFKGEDASVLKQRHSEVVQAAKQAASSLGKNSTPVVLFGYSANYAVFVHENVDAKFKRPGAKARWLYAALQTARERMLQKIHENARFR